jgi:hypothetical protein
MIQRPPRLSHWVNHAGGLKISTRRDYLRQLKYYLSKNQKFEEYIADKTNPAKEYLDLKFLVYFQCFNQKKATFEALRSLRRFYPDVKVHLVSDKGEDFSEIAKYFGCDYTYAQENLAYWPCRDIIAWFGRLYDTCKMYKDVDWIIIMEDDVRVRDRISKYPNANLAGQGGWNGSFEGAHLSKAAKDYVWSLHPGLEINGFSGCGGSIFHRASFMECYENIKAYNVEKFRQLDERLTWATDIGLTFLFLINGLINRRWLDLSEDSVGPWAYGPAAAFDHKFRALYNQPLTEEDARLLGGTLR